MELKYWYTSKLILLASFPAANIKKNSELYSNMAVEVIKNYSDRASWPIFCEMHSSSFHWQSLLCQTSQNPQQDRQKLTHINFWAVESISDILSVTNRCFVNKTCMYKRPQNVLTRSVMTAKDNSCHHAMSYQITAKRLFSTLLTPKCWLQTNTVIYRGTPSAGDFAPLVQKNSDFEDQIGKSFWPAGNGNCSVAAKSNTAKP